MTQTRQGFNIFWLLLALGALAYWGYHFYFSPEKLVETSANDTTDVQEEETKAAQSAFDWSSEVESIIDKVLSPLDDPVDLNSVLFDLRDMEAKAIQAGNREAGRVRVVLRELREVVKQRQQHLEALESIEAGRFAGLTGTRSGSASVTRKEYALTEQKRIWSNYAESTRPRIMRLLYLKDE